MKGMERQLLLAANVGVVRQKHNNKLRSRCFNGMPVDPELVLIQPHIIVVFYTIVN